MSKELDEFKEKIDAQTSEIERQMKSSRRLSLATGFTLGVLFMQILRLLGVFG